MADSLETGLILMAAGMGTVYALLVLLVWLVGFVSSFCRWLEPAPAALTPAPATTSPATGVDPEVIGVIGAAVKAHRDGRQSGQPRSS